MSGFFEVDQAGLAKLAERRGKSFVVSELIQNAWDTGAKLVKVTIDPVPGKPLCRVLVEDDDPDGFKNLSHAWTLFAESNKKGDPGKRGRFNLGEKLVLACCQSATIETTVGTVSFSEGRRSMLRRKRQSGSLVSAMVRMTREEMEEVSTTVRRMLVPQAVETFFNGERLSSRVPAGIDLDVILMTELADADGYLRRRPRKTKVEFYRPMEGEVGTLYEMGIAVCETGDKYHANVMQKIPLNMERDGVSAGYLRDVRVSMLNTMQGDIKTMEEASAPWVRDAFSDPNVEKPAAGRVMDLRFGRERVSYDPSDVEANSIAVSRGMTVVAGGSMSAEEWDRARDLGLVMPAGKVTPSPKPFTPGGDPLKVLHFTEYTEATNALLEFAVRLHRALDLGTLTIRVADDSEWGFAGCYSRGERQLIVNYAAMKKVIEERNMVELLRFLIHEFAHHFESNHLSENFHEACCRLGAKAVQLALQNPKLIFDL